MATSLICTECKDNEHNECRISNFDSGIVAGWFCICECRSE